MTATTNPAIAEATASVAAAAAQAAADPNRPIYHFRPPANWMNDPNGTIYHNGYYHLFYQHNPYGDAWGRLHWGHARSADLVHWEQLPIALWPSLEANEEHVFSGCAAVNGNGDPILIYTSVKCGDRESRAPNEQWAAIGDRDWLTWQKHPENPVLALETHGGPPFEKDWRDPFIFHEAGRTFLVLGGEYNDVAAVALYEATDDTLAHWRYCKLLYQEPRRERRFLECPNFFKIGEKWVLLTSPYNLIEYMVGDFDVETLTFVPQQQGVLDPGMGSTPNFYASNILYDPEGRCILLGWVRGFPEGRGWNGCLALPRILTIGPDGRPEQRPVPQLQELRKAHHSESNFTLHNDSHVVTGIQGTALEIQMLVQPETGTVALRTRRSADGQRAVEITYDGATLDVLGTQVPLTLSDEEPLKLHLFLDQSVLELFVNGGRVAVTRIIDAPPEDTRIEVAVRDGAATVVSLDIWTMDTIWP
jgi:beta-fructofuranosidase